MPLSEHLIHCNTSAVEGEIYDSNVSSFPDTKVDTIPSAIQPREIFAESTCPLPGTEFRPATQAQIALVPPVHEQMDILVSAAFGIKERLSKTAFRMRFEEDQVDDIFQEMVTKGLENLDTFDWTRVECMRAWLLKIGLNYARSWIRHGRLIRFISSDLLREQEDGSTLEMSNLFFDTSEDSSPEVQAIASERETVVWEAVNHLPLEQRDVIFFSYYLERTHSEIAEELGIPPGTVKKRTFLGRRKIKEELEEYASA